MDFAHGHSGIRRLFPDFKRVEQDYLRRTGIFPIMHLLVIRRELYEKHPFIASVIYRACCQAKDLALRKIRFLAAPQNMLPWLPSDVDEMDEFFGGDPYPYGIEANRATLDKLVSYLEQQAIIARRIPVDELFVPVEP